MATIRFISEQYMSRLPTDWPNLAFATIRCCLGQNEPLGSIEHLTQCGIVTEMNQQGMKYHVADHVGNVFDVLVPCDKASGFTPLQKCQECKYKSR